MTANDTIDGIDSIGTSPMPGEEQTKIRATLIKNIFTNEAGDWSLSIFQAGGCNFKASGHDLPEIPHLEVVLLGHWGQYRGNPVFQADSYYVEAPSSEQQLLAYLASLRCGIGTISAKRLYQKYGSNTLTVCKEDPDAVKALCPKLDPDRLAEGLKSTTIIRELLQFFGAGVLSLELIKRVAKRLGNDAVQIIRRNPYKLMSVHGIGFHKADQISLQQGMEPLSNPRISAAMWHELTVGCTGNGHLYWPEKVLFERTTALLTQIGSAKAQVNALTKERWNAKLKDILGSFEKKNRAFRVGDAIYGVSNWEQEHQLASRVAEFAMGDNAFAIDVAFIQRQICQYEASEGISLAQQQRRAIYNALREPISIITGGAGTGKTTVIKAILYVLNQWSLTLQSDLHVRLMAPTGRAAKRMASCTGMTAETIHRAIQLGYDTDGICHGAKVEQLVADVIIVDEASMVDSYLANELFGTIPSDAHLILLGDPNQLPSVGPGNVLRELITSDCIPVTKLDVIFRQSEISPIVYNSLAVIRGECKFKWTKTFSAKQIYDPDTLVAEVVEFYLTAVQALGIENVLLLNPSRNLGAITTARLNREIQEKINPKKEGDQCLKVNTQEFRIGDRVMQTRNQDNGITNGDIGVIVGFESVIAEGEKKAKLKARIQFDSDEVLYSAQELQTVQLAYCSTVHKAQGSEAEAVIMVMTPEHHCMHQRNLLYTGITRAKSYFTFFGDLSCVEGAIKNEVITKRYTRLAETLRDECGYPLEHNSASNPSLRAFG